MAAVAARVRVVGLDDVAEQERGAAIRVRRSSAWSMRSCAPAKTLSRPTSGAPDDELGPLCVAKATISPIGASDASTGTRGP